MTSARIRPTTTSINHATIAGRTADVFGIDNSKVTVEKYDGNKCIALMAEGHVEAEGMLKCMVALRYQVKKDVVSQGKTKKVVHYVPSKVMLEFLEALFESRTRYYVNNYLYLYTCFSYILPLILQPEQYEINVQHVNIKISLGQAIMLKPLLDNPNIVKIIDDYKCGFTLSFDNLMKTPHHELETIFKLLAPGTGIHEWKTIPITVMVARFMAILDVQGMVAGLKVNTFNPQDESAFLTMPNGHLRSDIFRTFLRSKGYVVYVKPADNYFAITQKDAVKFLRSCDRDSGILEEFERMMRIHRVFVDSINATKLLQIEYSNHHGLVSYQGQRTATNGVMIMFEANSLSLFNAKDILYRLTNMAKLKELCDRSNGCLTAVCEDGEVLIRTDALNLGLQLFNGADISLISEGNATNIRIGWNAFGMFSSASYETLKVDIDQIVAVHQVKTQLAAKLTACIKRNKIAYTYNESHITLTLDDHDACLLSPLLIRLNSEAKAGVYTYSAAQVTRLLQPEQHDVFARITARHEMLALYRALSAVLGSAFISRMKAALAVEGEMVFNDEFFNMGIEKLKAVRAEVEAQQRKVEVMVPSAPRQVSAEPLSPKIRRKIVEPVSDYVGSVDLLPAIKAANSGVNKTGTSKKLKKSTKPSATSKPKPKSTPANQPVVSAKIKSLLSSKEKPAVRTPLPKPDDYVDVSHLPVNLDQLTISQAVPKKKKCGNIKKVNKAIREASIRLEDSLPFVSSEQQEEGRLAVHYSTLFTLLKLMDAIHTRHQASDLCVQLTTNDADAGEILEALTVYLPPFAGLLEFQRLLATEGRLQDVLTGIASTNKKPISLKASFSFFAHQPEVDVVQSVHTTFRDMIKLGHYFNDRFKEFEAQADVKVATASVLFACQQPLPAHEAEAIQGCINKLARLHTMVMQANLRDKFPAEVIKFMETCVVEKREVTLEGLRKLVKLGQAAYVGHGAQLRK